MNLVAAALSELGVKRFLLAIHDVSFPSDPDEDIGRGAPTTRAAARFLAYTRALGFTGVQLGPQGQTSRGNPSPYDSTIFSRHLGTIAVSSFRPGGPYEGLVDEAALDGLLWHGGGRAQHAHAYDAAHALVDAARAHIGRARLAAFIAQHDSWLARDIAVSGDKTDRYAVGQLLAHEEHDRLRATCARLGLALYGDLQVGYSPGDAHNYAAAFLAGYRMGAPPSRTNPDGQPWNYPVLDPDQLDAGAARDLLVARIDKAFAEYDSIRIDHPHGLVCPWVYAVDRDPAVAVREGARLYESPDLDDHPLLARHAIARAEQLDRGVPRYHDRWVRALDDAQVARYARLFDLFAECARRNGRAMADVSCEVLSTMPLPLERVLQRHGLGRWRVTQKANLDDATDVYRTENARREDWVMLGNHDTAPVFALIAKWSAETRAKWVRHLTAKLAPAAPRWDDDRFVASAMLAELFACDAENVSIFWADLFGYTERFNAPGTVSDANWCLRLPPDFERLAPRGLDIPLALELALAARRAS